MHVPLESCRPRWDVLGSLLLAIGAGCSALDVELLSRPMGLLGPICLFGAYLPGTDEAAP